MTDEELIEQLCKDLQAAHDEVLRAQGHKERHFKVLAWPEWSPQANSIRIAEKRLGKRLNKAAIAGEG